MGDSKDENRKSSSSNATNSQDTGMTQKVDSIFNSNGARNSNPIVEGESFCVEVLRGPTKGDLIFLKAERNTFGRDDDCTVMLDDITVSRHHCEIISKDGELILNDLGSTNGTYVNSNPIESCRIETGDVIQIGKFVFALARRTQI